jgi:hypothetical protein
MQMEEVEQSFEKMSAHVEGLHDQNREREGESQAALFAIANLVALLNATGKLDGRFYVEMLRRSQEGKPVATASTLAVLADAIAGMLARPEDDRGR